ncbi:MAG: enoyl-CoA hydratase-related protein [Myxococcota bacterium]
MNQLTDVRYATDGPIATITLDRPEARNAYSEAMVDGLIAAFDAAESDASIRSIVLTGAGKAFSAGGDLKRMAADQGMFAGDDPVALRRSYIMGIQRIPQRLARVDKPIVAAINGAAIGAGLDLACMCDLRVAADTAKLGSTFVRVGLVPGDGGAFFLARTIGLPRALELMLTGRVIDAATALRLDLVHEVCSPEETIPRARAIALEIARHAPLAVQLTKRAAYRSFETDLSNALELAATYQGIAQRTDDHREGVAALLERRDPKFSGR